MAQPTLPKGIKISFSNTPQAKDDQFAFAEGIEGNVQYLDVMGNDLAGNAKWLYALDDSVNSGGINGDLLQQDAVNAIAYSYLGARIWITADGKVAYDASTLDLDALAEGQHLTDTFTYAIRMASGALSWATATVDIVGTNDGPGAVADTNGGDAVVESGVAAGGNTPAAGDASAAGNVLSNDSDVDVGDVLTVSGVAAGSAGGPVSGNVGTAVTGTYGALTLGANGSWSYALNNADTDTNALAEDEAAADVFTYTVSDGHGGFATTTLTINITGTNDVPTVTGDNSASLQEDALPATQRGELTVGDVDNGATHTWSIVGGTSALQDFNFSMDEFRIERNNQLFFDDTFSNNIAPTSAPNIVGGGPVSYGTSGPFFESVDRLLLAGTNTVLASTMINGQPSVIQSATLLTNNVLGNTTAGLKSNMSFTVEGRFDLIMPADIRDQYGIRLNDSTSPTTGDDIISLAVRRDADGINVNLSDLSFVAGTGTLLESIDLSPAAGDDQIALRLSHDPTQPGVITAEFDLLDNGLVTSTTSFTTTGQIFNGENWTRAQIHASGAPENISMRQGTYATLTVDQDGDWTARTRNGRPEVQALAEGETVTETFDIQVTDEHGASAIQQIAVDVTGTNDAPIITGGQTTGAVQEDGNETATGTLTATDVDNGATRTWSVVGDSGPHVPDYQFAIDNFDVIKNGATIFADPFEDNNPPPSAPSFTNSTPASYSTGNTLTEAGGRAIMDAAVGTTPVAIGEGIGHFVTLNTNTDPNNLLQGLKSNHDFVVEGRFDLVIPDIGERYGVRLTDDAPNHTGDDTMSLTVNREADGVLRVTLTELDFVSDQRNTIASLVLNPASGDDQIVLRLTHQAVNPGVVAASFDLLANGDVTYSDSLPGFGQIFGTETPGNPGDNENWTRAGFSSADLIGPTHYGTLSINQNGNWTYDLANEQTHVQALAEGETVIDSFTVQVTDEHGAADTETINITVTGENDAPIITGGQSTGAVQENGASSVTGTLAAFDIDHGATRAWSIVGGGQPDLADYHFLIDNFDVVRNGTLWYDDAFDDGNPPPAGGFFFPNTPDASAGTYSVPAGTITESGGRAILDGAHFASLFAIGSGAGHFVALNSDTSSDLSRGLKIDDTFTVEGRFDLITPDSDENYGIRVTDNTGPSHPGNDAIQLLVLPGGLSGALTIGMSRLDFVNNTVTPIDGVGISPAAGDDQIVLRLHHDALNPGVITATYELLSNGIPTGGGALSGSAQIFGLSTPGDLSDDEIYTRAQFVAGEAIVPSMLNGQYGTLSLNQNGTWTYLLANGQANVQALAEGEMAFDTFDIQVTDEHGASDTQTVTISVAGKNDAPLFAPPGFPTGLTETPDTTGSSVALIAPVSLAFTDVDLNDAGHTAIVTGVSTSGIDAGLPDPAILLSWLTIDGVTKNVGSSFGNVNATLSAPDSAFDYLGQGELAFLHYTVQVDDHNGGVSDVTFLVKIEGRNDQVIITAADASGAVHEMLDGAPGEGASTHTATGTINFADVDLTDPHSVIVQPTPLHYLGTFAANITDSANGDGAGAIGWTFSVADSVLEGLAEGQTLTQSYDVALFDNRGGMAIQTVTIALNGSNDAPVITVEDLVGAVTEQVTPIGNLTDSGTIAFSDVDLTDVHLVSPNGAPIGSTLGSLTAVKDADSTGTGTGGQLTWTYSVAAAAVEYLAAGQTRVESFTIALDDQNGGVITRQIDVTITGTNDAPVIDTAAVSHALTEDQSAPQLTATGLAPFTDVDLTDTHTFQATLQSAALSFGGAVPAGLNAALLTAMIAVYSGPDTPGDGQGEIRWDFALANSAVQFLAQGQVLTAVYNVNVLDPFGGTDTQQVTVNITGTNDAPVITGGPTAGSVQEDGALTATGTLTAIDVDSSAQRVWSVVGDGNLPFADYYAEIDNFRIWRNGNVFFEDGFDDGLAPPLAPPIFSGTPTSYAVQSGIITEADGHAIMQGADGGPFAFNAGIGHFPSLASNTSNDLNLGLKVDDNLVVEGTFNLILPDVNESFGIRLSDRFISNTFTNLGDDTIQLILSRGADNVLRIVMSDINFVTETVTFLGSRLLTVAPGDDQITLRLSHLASNPGVVGGSYDLLDNGVVTFSDSVPGVGTIFSNEVYTRAVFLAQENVPTLSVLNGVYGSLTINQGGTWTYQLANGQTNVQELAAGHVVHDVFTVRVTDQYGAFDTETIDVTVTGTNDAPDAVDDVIGGSGGKIAVFGGTDGTSPIYGAGNVANDLAALGVFDSVTVLDGSESAATLSQYDAILAYTNSYGSFASFGNTLADYLDAGGNMVAATFAYQDQPGGTDWGRLETGGYFPYQTYLGNYVLGSLGAYDSSHPIFQGPLTITGISAYYRDIMTLSGDAILVASWAEGRPLVAIDGGSGVVGITLFPNDYYGQVSGDYMQLFGNALVYAGGGTANDEDTVLTIGQAQLLANDSDPDSGDVLSIVSVSATSTLGALVSINLNGDVVYDPAAALEYLADGETVTDSFTYTISDGHGGFDTATVSLAVAGVNDAPVAVGESYSTDEDTPLTVTAAGVLGNDSDVDGPSLSAILVSGPSHGSVALNTDGSFTYTPSTNYNGADSFTYKANDGLDDSNVAVVNLTIGAINDAPVINVAAGPTFTTIDVPGLANDIAIGINDAGDIVGQGDLDPSHQRGWLYDGTTFSIISAFGAQDTSAHAINNLDVIAGDYSPTRSTPRYGFIDVGGTFTQIASDSPYPSTNANGINDAGVIVGSDYLHPGTRYAGYIYNNGTFTYLSVPGTNNPAGDTFAADINDNGLIVGSFNPNAFNPNGYQGFLYNNGNYTTIANPLGVKGTYAQGINDAGQIVGWYYDAAGTPHGYVNTGGNFTTIDNPLGTHGTIINGINDAGQVVGYYLDTSNVSHAFVASLDANATDEDTPLLVKAISVSDVDAGSDPIQLRLGVAHGTLALGSTAGLAGDLDGSDGELLFTGSQAAINTALAGGLIYAPGLNYFGPDTLAIDVDDLGHNGVGGALTASQSIGITVNPVNDAPTAVADTVAAVGYSTNEDTAVSLYVLGNDLDPDNDTLSFAGLGTPLNSSITTSNGANVTIAGDHLVYDPSFSAFLQALAAGQSVVDSFTYTAADPGGLTSQATVEITVQGENDAPVITQLAGPSAADPIHVAENTVGSFVTVTATDAENQTLTYSLGANPNGSYDNQFFTINGATGELSFTTPPDFEFDDPGNDDLYKVQVTATDTQGGTATRDYFVSVTDVAEGRVNPTILFVDDDGGINTNGTWVSTLNQLGYSVTYEAISTNGNPVSALPGYDVVIWSVGDRAYDNLTSQNVATLSSYLNGGGNLLYAGGHNLYSEPTAFSFVNSYLGLSNYTYNMPYVDQQAHLHTTGPGGTYTITDMSNDGVSSWYGGTMLSAFQAAAPTADMLMEISSGGAHSGHVGSAYFDPTNNDVAAINDTGIFKAATWGFDINQLDPGYRADFLDTTVQLLGGAQWNDLF